ncbi:TniQ family protein [Rhizobium sp.]|uniref:TniQ family protein n=1 Tax=Rhizobium sp. TaxID=391 RepID=UPI0034C63D69
MTTLENTRLPNPVKLSPAELSKSYVFRLAHANGFSSLEEFFEILGLVGVPTALGLKERAAELAALLGNVPVVDLRRFDPPSTGAVVSFGYSTVKRVHLRFNKAGFCPHCLREDVKENGPYLRGHWWWEVVTHCEKHGCELLPLPDEIWDSPDFSGLLAASGGEIVESQPADRYFGSRMTEPPGSGFLDQFPAYVAAELCTVIGQFRRLVETGADPKSNRGAIDRGMRLLGFDTASRGESAIREVLLECSQMRQSRYLPALAIFSPAQRWWRLNKYNPDYTPLMKMFQRFAEEMLPLAAGEVFMWPAKKRVLHTMRSAHLEYGLSFARVSKVLKTRGEILPDSQIFDRAKTHYWFLEEMSLISMKDAAALLGCTVHCCRDLIEAGLLLAAPRGGEKRELQTFHRLEVERFLKSLRGRLAKIPITDRHRKLASSTRHSFIETIEFILDGSLKRAIQPAGTSRIDEILFDRDEIAEAAARHSQLRSIETHGFDGNLLKIKSACRRLNLTEKGINALVAQDILPEVRVITNGKSLKHYRSSDLDAVGDRICTVQSILDQGKFDRPTIIARLAKSGITRICGGRDDRVKIYERRGIESIGLI